MQGNLLPKSNQKKVWIVTPPTKSCVHVKLYNEVNEVGASSHSGIDP